MIKNFMKGKNMRILSLIFMLTTFLLAGGVLTHELVVPNMGCGGCAKKIKRVVDGNYTLISMDFNTTTKDVNLTMPSEIDINSVIKTINDAGYKARLKEKQ